MGQGATWGKKRFLQATVDAELPVAGPYTGSTRASEVTEPAAAVLREEQQESTTWTAGSLSVCKSVRLHDSQECADRQAVSGKEECPEAAVTKCSSLPQAHETGTGQTCILIVKSFLGGAFLFLPHAMLTGGMVLSLCTMVVVFLVALYCVYLLLHCCAPGLNETYEQLGHKAYGAWGRFIVEICIVLSQLSFCTINAVVVWGNLRDVVWTVGDCSPAHKWSVVTLLWMGALYFVPVSLITNLKYLAPLMLIGNIGMAGGVLLLLVAVSLARPAAFWTGTVALAVWENWPIAIGTSIFMWEGAGLIMPVRNAATKKVQKRFTLLLSTCLGFLLALYVGYTLFCIAVFGQTLKVVILANLSPGPLGLTVQSVFALAIMATYPLLLFPASAVVERRLIPDRKRMRARTFTLLRSLLRITLVIITLLAATVGLRQLDCFVALAGSLCGAPLTFLFPPLLHVKLHRKTPFILMLLHYTIILLGTCILVFSIYWTISTWRGTDDFPARCSGKDV